MTREELQQTLEELHAFAETQKYPADREPAPNVPRLFHIAVDEPFGDNDCDAHDRDYVYSAWLTSDGLEKLKRDSKGRISYWPAGWYPSVEALIAWCGSDDDDSIWQKEGLNMPTKLREYRAILTLDVMFPA